MALTEEGALGYGVIKNAIDGFRRMRGGRQYRDGYWCYNSFRRGIDLMFRVNGAQSDTIGLEMVFKNRTETVQATPVEGYCRFRLEDVFSVGGGKEIVAIKQNSHKQDFLTDEIKDGYDLLKKMLKKDVRDCVAFAARSTETLHPIIPVGSKDFECARLAGGVWVVGYNANVSNAYILSGGTDRIFAAYINMSPTKEEQCFEYKNLKFKYKSSRQERMLEGVDDSLRVFEADSKRELIPFTNEKIVIYRGGEQFGEPIFGNDENKVTTVTRDARKYVFIPQEIKKSALAGKDCSSSEWEYVPFDQTQQEVAITGKRKGEITIRGPENKTLLVEIEAGTESDLFWIEDRGIVKDSNLTLDDENSLESHRLCFVPARRYAGDVCGCAKVKCRYQVNNRNKEFNLTDSRSIVGDRMLFEYEDSVFYEDVRNRNVRYNVLKIPLIKLLNARNNEPQTCETDCIKVDSRIDVKVLNRPSSVVFSSKNGCTGIYVPQAEREKRLLLVSDKWLGEECEMGESDHCKVINLEDLCSCGDDWVSIQEYLTGYDADEEVYGAILPCVVVDKVLQDQSLFNQLSNGNCLRWIRIKTANVEATFVDYEVLEQKLRVLGALNGNNGFFAAVKALLGRGLSNETFALHWRNVGTDLLSDFLDQALGHGVNFLAIGDNTDNADGWYHGTWMSHVFEDLCQREFGVSNELPIVTSFKEQDLTQPQLPAPERDRRRNLNELLGRITPITNSLQGDSWILASALTSFLLESNSLVDTNLHGFWPKGQENCQEFQNRTRSWRNSGVKPLKQLATMLNNNIPLDTRIWCLTGGGHGWVNPHNQREFFVGDRRIVNVCSGPLDNVNLGTMEFCHALAAEAKECCDSNLPETLRTSCVSGVLSGLLDNIAENVGNAGTQCLNAELLFVAVIVSRMTAFLNGRARVVSDESMAKITVMLREAFRAARAWKLVMFYATAVDVLVWFGTKVDCN